MRPMKFSEANIEDVQAMLDDPSFVMEQKADGSRGLAVIEVSGIWFPGNGGRGSLAHTAAIQHLPSINAHLASLISKRKLVLDGEIMIRTGEFIVWDMPYYEGVIENSDPFAARRAVLESLFETLGDGPVKLMKQARSAEEKCALWQAVKDGGGEGVMAKRLDSPYEQGVRVKHSLKLKFVHTADVVVMAVNRPDPKHGSFSFGVYVDGVLTPLGNCSAIGKPDAQVGDVIEVNFLYREPESGGLVQPRMMKIREDRKPESCTPDQFAPYSRAMR